MGRARAQDLGLLLLLEAVTWARVASASSAYRDQPAAALPRRGNSIDLINQQLTFDRHGMRDRAAFSETPTAS